jgi:hypothetical protein
MLYRNLLGKLKEMTQGENKNRDSEIKDATLDLLQNHTEV